MRKLIRNLIQIWRNKFAITAGIKNVLIRDEFVEKIAAKREAICKQCPDMGSDCMVPGTHPCCNLCGCSLKVKLRSLSSQCGNEKNPKWLAMISEEEEERLDAL